MHSFWSSLWSPARKETYPRIFKTSIHAVHQRMGTDCRRVTLHHRNVVFHHNANHPRSMYRHVHIISSNDNFWDFTNRDFRIHWSLHSNLLLNRNNDCLLVLLHPVSIIQRLASRGDLALRLRPAIDHGQHPNSNSAIRLSLRNTKVLPPPPSKD